MNKSGGKALQGDIIKMYSNPFSSFLSSGVFLPDGREEILAEIAHVITLPQPDDRELHGLPGTGKTSLLRYVYSPEFIHTYREDFLGIFALQPHRLFILYIAGWIESIHPYVLLYREYFNAYQSFYDRMTVDHPEIELPEPIGVDVADLDGGHAFALMEPHLRRLDKSGIRTVMLLDDFDSDLAYKRLDAEQTARLSSWNGYCSLILATERRLESVNRESKGSPLYKRLPEIPFRDMLPEEADIFLRRVLALENRGLPDEDIKCLIEWAGGFPYLLLLAGRALWDLRRRTGLTTSPDTPLPETVIPYLNQRLMSEFSRMFEQYMKNLDTEQRLILAELARQGSLPMDIEAMGRQDSRLAGLEQYGLVDLNVDGRVTLFSPLFRKFLLDQSSSPAALATKLDAEGEPSLTELQANLYNVLRSKPDEVVTFEELGEKVWSWPSDSRREPSDEDKRKIHIAVSKLRRELEKSSTGERIVNLRARGYRFEPAR